MLKKLLTYLLVFISFAAYAQEQKEMDVPKGSKSGKETKKRVDDHKQADMKAYLKAVEKMKKVQTKETRKRMKQTKKKADKWNGHQPDTFWEKLFRRKQKKK